MKIKTTTSSNLTGPLFDRGEDQKLGLNLCATCCCCDLCCCCCA